MAVREIAEGAEAKIYRCSVLGIDAVAKQRIRKAYRITELDERLRYHRTKVEAKVMSMLYGKIDLPAVLLVGKDTIYMTYIEGERLSDAPVALQRRLAVAGRHLAAMHNEDITHGDFTPANLIASGGRTYVIDFGLSYSTNSIEDKALDLLLMKRSVDAKQYVRFLEGYRSASRDYRKIADKLAEIETRGRYQSRTLATVE